MSPEIAIEPGPLHYDDLIREGLAREIERQLAVAASKRSRREAFEEIQWLFNSYLPHSAVDTLAQLLIKTDRTRSEWPPLGQQLEKIFADAPYEQYPRPGSLLEENLRQHPMKILWARKRIDFGHVLAKGPRSIQENRLPICKLWTPYPLRPLINFHGPSRITPAMARLEDWETEPTLQSPPVLVWLGQLDQNERKKIKAVLFPGLSVVFPLTVISTIGQALEKKLKKRGGPGPGQTDAPRGLESAIYTIVFPVLSKTECVMLGQKLPYKITFLVGQYRWFSPEAEEIIESYRDRITASMIIGRSEQARALSNPFQGGLPGLGKRS